MRMLITPCYVVPRPCLILSSLLPSKWEEMDLVLPHPILPGRS